LELEKMLSLEKLTIKNIHSGLLKKSFSALELTEAFLAEIKEKDKDIHAFLTLTEELALSQAKRLDKKIQNREEIGLLAGVPVGIKDNILVEDVKCTAASRILENYIASYDATVIKKLKKAEAIIIGKTNLDEFAMGASTESSAYGPTKNPHDLERVPGGTSGGSAAAIASNECICALGSDTGGSVRQPSAFCGIVGFRPTYGQVSRYGLMAMASSLDQIGPMAKTVEEAKLLFDVIKGNDEMDSTSIREQKTENREQKIPDLKIGIPKEYFVQGIDKEVEKLIRDAVSKYEQMGAKIVEINLLHTEYAVPCYYIIVPAEISANLARYDGVRYGFRSDSNDILSEYLKTRQQGFGDEPKRRIMIGTYVLSAGYYDAYYKKAQKVRNLIKQDFKKAFEKVDVIMCPTAPDPAFKFGEKMDDPLKMYLCDIYTAPASLAGLPALSLPCGRIGKLPVACKLLDLNWLTKKYLT